MQTATIEQRQQRDKEAYDASVFERRLTDEITNATERIAVPMRNTFEYEFDGEDLWFQGENIRHILERTIEVNKLVVRERPEYMTELIRNYTELDEYGAELMLAAGNEGDPDVLAVMTPIPDAVVAGVDLGAYDKDRMKMLVRIYKRTPGGIEATSLSLDGSDRAGMEAIASRFGKDIPADATSEDILAMRMWGWSDDFEDDVINDVRNIYDNELTRQYGGKWHAGRQDKVIRDARAFVEAQPDLIREHMDIVGFIHEFSDTRTRKAELKAARYNFAAALSRRLRGDADAASMGDAGEAARANGETYDGDCPDADEISATQSLNKLGVAKTGEIKMTCPFCHFETYGDPCADVLKCSECSATVANRQVVSKGIGRAGVMAKHAAERQAKERPRKMHSEAPRKEELIAANYGPYARLRNETVVGGVEQVVYDARTGREIERL